VLSSVAGTTPNFAQFEVVFLVGCVYSRWSDILWNFSILLGPICKFPNDSDARTNRGLGVLGLYSVLSVRSLWFDVRVEWSVLDL
jgi:hypothetical protein